MKKLIFIISLLTTVAGNSDTTDAASQCQQIVEDKGFGNVILTFITQDEIVEDIVVDDNFPADDNCFWRYRT